MAEDKTDLDTNSENENVLNVVQQILNDLVDDCVGAVGVAETTDIEESEDAYPILLRSLSYPILLRQRQSSSDVNEIKEEKVAVADQRQLLTSKIRLANFSAPNILSYSKTNS